VLVPIKVGKTAHLKCRKCSYTEKGVVKELKIGEKIEHKRGIILLERDDVPLATTDKACPKCDHPKAYFWLQQTRAADEPPTQFFRCTKCKHVWREYK
jgi:DNA-directed RNA polymerase subunit M